MKLKFITFEHVNEAVKYLVSKGGEDHLPYTESDGSPNHRLMGAAWAALHGGYRGKKYEGPDKSKAIAKLKAVYKSEQMDTPAESFAIDGEFFQEALPAGNSFDAIRSRVQSALDKAVRMGRDMDLDGDDDSGECCYCWVRDLFPGTVVYSMNGDLFQVDYTDDGEAVTLGTPVEVEMSYTPVSAAAESGRPGQMKTRAVQREVVTISESAYDSSKGKLTVTVIKPGFSQNTTKGKRRYYPADVLKRDLKVFEGAKMFVDHATEAEQKARPEGSVHDWVANLGNVWAESDGSIKGEATVFDPGFKSKLDALNTQGLLKEMAISMRTAVAWSPAEIEGQEAARVDELIAAKSVDFVTYAGAGGQVEAMESQSDDWDVDVIGEAEFRKRRPDLVEVIESSAQGATMKSLEQQLQEANTQLAAEKKRADDATAKVEESAKTAKKATVQAELTKMLTESKLPEVSQKRIQEMYKDAVEITGVKESIAAESEYVKSLGGTAQVKNLGSKQNGSGGTETANESRQSLVESFKAAGMTEDQAKIAAAGR
jgi:hypothetical protein